MLLIVSLQLINNKKSNYLYLLRIFYFIQRPLLSNGTLQANLDSAFDLTQKS